MVFGFFILDIKTGSKTLLLWFFIQSLPARNWEDEYFSNLILLLKQLSSHSKGQNLTFLDKNYLYLYFRDQVWDRALIFQYHDWNWDKKISNSETEIKTETVRFLGILVLITRRDRESCQSLLYNLLRNYQVCTA